MSEGLLQQVGTPQALYDQPANRFVAGFIGSPSMNFVDVTVEGTGADAKLVGAGDFVGPAAAPLRASPWQHGAGRKIIAGFRPEHLELGDGRLRHGDASRARPTSSSTSATRSSSTSPPPARTSSRSSTRRTRSSRATS